VINSKFEARNPKLETISESSNVPNNLDSDFSFGFHYLNISSFEIVSDFDIRISNLGNKHIFLR